MVPGLCTQNWLFNASTLAAAAVAAQLEAARLLRLDRHQHAGGQREQAAEIVGGHRRAPSLGGVGEPRGVDGQRAAVGQVQAVQRIAAALVIDAAHDQPAALPHVVLAGGRARRAGEDDRRPASDPVPRPAPPSTSTHAPPLPLPCRARNSTPVRQSRDAHRRGAARPLPLGPLVLSWSAKIGRPG